MTEDTMIAGLLREREGLVQRGLDDRVAQVDEQLKARGYTPPTDRPASGEPASRSTAPKGRRTRSTEKA
ncbi:hypothetical protein [Streptomyces sp. NPDC057460]|uniref:hypothetical protein n=1 Tax=Streptomyces sp. NPDC057460 TaxID=3346141 RepID=UPI0036A48D9A